MKNSFNWTACVSALDTDGILKFAAWRGLSIPFVAALKSNELLGVHDGNRIAMPIKDATGTVIGCHYRLREDGSWHNFPPGVQSRHLVLGNTARARAVYVFASAWDAFAILDRLDLHPSRLTDIVAVITQAPGDGRLLGDFSVPHAKFYAFPSNDASGQRWLAEITGELDSPCFRVSTPSPHPTLSCWTKAGATAADLLRTIEDALPLEPQSGPSVGSSPIEIQMTPVLAPSQVLDADDPAPAEFPLDALPASLATLVSAVSQTERVPLALPAVCALAVTSAAVGAGLTVASGPSRTTRGNLFLLVSAESGSGKSETFRIVAAPLLDHQERLIENWRTQTSPRAKSELMVLEKEIEILQRKAAKCQDPFERDSMIATLQSKTLRQSQVAQTATVPSLIAQDVTTERLAVMLHENREVMFSASADARKPVDNILGRYNPGGGTDEALYLNAFSGDLTRVDRQDREPVILKRPCLALCWLIQPDLLARLMDEESLQSGGFLARLLVCHSRAVPRKIGRKPEQMSETTRERWIALVTALLGQFHAATTPHQILVPDNCLNRLNEFYNSIVDRRAADLADVGIFAARYAEQAWRISVVLHAALHGAAAGSESLELETASNAIRITEWFIDAQLDILGKSRKSAAKALEAEIVALLKNNVGEGRSNFITARDVARGRITGDAPSAQRLLDGMVSSRRLCFEDEVPPRGGRTVRKFRLVNCSLN